MVSRIEPDSPAMTAQLREDDVIVALDGHPTPRVETLHRLLTADRIGRTVELRALRGVELVTLTITPREMPAR